MSIPGEKTRRSGIFLSEPALHGYFWVFFFLSFFILNLPGRKTWEALAFAACLVVLALPPVYLHFFWLKTFFRQGKYVFYGVFYTATVGVFGFVIHQVLASLFQDRNTFFTHTLNVVGLTVFTTAIHFVKTGIRERMLLQEIKSKQLQTELDLLKAQIHPHFLFNTLNNLFALARKNKDFATADGIAGLSHLMRYMLSDSSEKKVPLEKEADQIRRFIGLQKLRFEESDDVSIDFRTSGDFSNYSLPPMLLIPFAENAFKHGISLNAPSRIEIELEAGENRIIFSVINSMTPATGNERPSLSPGMGLTNVVRRLELLYPNSHRLDIGEEQGRFRVRLEIEV